MTSEATDPQTTDPLSLITRLCEKKGSAVLLLQDESRRGEIHLHHGRVVRASTGSLHGEQALFGMLMWPSAKTWIAPLFERPEINVFSDLFFLSEEDELEALSAAR